jgi:NAD(P)-dependent dehydrogenase (short-subunit alcohol dehydrogenase family)
MTRVAVVTGGGTGIGRAVALTLAGEGYAVVVAGRRREPLDETAAMGRADGADVVAVPTDVRIPHSVRDLFVNTRDRFGRVDVLFNNAGLSAPFVPFEDVSFEQWRAIVETNLYGPFLCAQEAVRLMKWQQPKGGRIINNGSVSAHTPRPCSAPYTATKHALSGLTKSLALDGRCDDIACSQIDIGNAETSMSDEEINMAQASGRMEKEPTIDVGHVARAVAYVAGLPLDANILFMTLMATKMPYVGRG